MELPTEGVESSARESKFELIGLLAKWSTVFVVGTAFLYCTGYVGLYGYLSAFIGGWGSGLNGKGEK